MSQAPQHPLSLLPMFRREPSRSQWLEVMRRDSYTCQYCGRRAAELDHV